MCENILYLQMLILCSVQTTIQLHINTNCIRCCVPYMVIDSVLLHSILTKYTISWRRIHKRTISLRFLSKILRVFRLEVFIYNVYIINKNHLLRVGGGGGGWIWIARRKILKPLVPITSKNSVSGNGITNISNIVSSQRRINLTYVCWDGNCKIRLAEEQLLVE